LLRLKGKSRIEPINIRRANWAITYLERLTKPFDIPPTDERASERKERLMDVCSPLVSDAQPAKAV